MPAEDQAPAAAEAHGRHDTLTIMPLVPEGSLIARSVASGPLPLRAARAFGLGADRLREVEREAGSARATAVNRLAALFQSRLGSEPDDVLWLTVRELTDAVTLLLGGQVDAVPNLAVNGERLAGSIRWRHAGWADVLYEEYDPPVRQRFSVAHELGHFRLHEAFMLARGGSHGDPLRRPEPDDDPVPGAEDGVDPDTGEHTAAIQQEDPVWEREADAFAAAFLIPARRLARDVKRFGRAVPFLAARYTVSAASMRRRIATLEVIGVIVPPGGAPLPVPATGCHEHEGDSPDRGARQVSSPEADS